MALCIADNCNPDKLLGRIEALETAVKAPAFSSWFRYLVEHSTDILALSGAIVALVGVGVLAVFIGKRLFRSDLQLTKATLSLAGSSVTVEAAAQEISDFMSDLQGYVVRDAAMTPSRMADQLSSLADMLKTAEKETAEQKAAEAEAAGENDSKDKKKAGTEVMQPAALDGKGKAADRPLPGNRVLMMEMATMLSDAFRAKAALPDGAASIYKSAVKPDATEPDHFSNLPKEKILPPERSILWVASNPEAIRFETKVLSAMGNSVETVLGEGDASIRLRSGLRPHLIVVDMASAAKTSSDPLAFVARLLRGFNGFDHALDPPQTEIGEGLRLAVLVAKGGVGFVRTRLESVIADLPAARKLVVDQNYFVTDSFFVLKERVEWMQRLGQTA